MGLLCIVLSPILPLAALDRDTLPNWLNWFQTPDATLDGDSGFAKLFPADEYPKYYRRVRWLIRNPAYGFAWTVLAYTPQNLDYKWVGSLAPETRKGMGYFFMWQDNGYFEYSIRIKLTNSKCFYFRCGWKIIGLATGGNTGKQKMIFTIQPLSSINDD